MPLLDRDTRGIPYFIMDMRWDTASAYSRNTLIWRDTTWVVLARSSIRSGFEPEFAVSGESRRAVLGLAESIPVSYDVWLTLGSAAPDSLGPPDSVFATTTQSTEYAAAATARRRWVIRSEQRQPELEFHVRVFYSDTARIWREVGRLGVDEDHCTVAPLGDTTAIVVYAGLSGLEYAILDGTRWTGTGNLDPRPFNAAHPRFRLRPSGGLWLFWADNDWMHMSSYRNGSWERGDSLRCVPVPGETFRPTFLDAEIDTTERPAFAWTNSGYGSTWRDVTAIAFPNDRGWDPGEEVPDSEMSGWFAPSLTTDLNGDVWLVWRRAREGVNRWTHTYCSATCTAPAVVPREGGARVSWTLTSRAPRSRWSVWRAAGEEGAFDSLGTVRAGEDSVLVFDDPAARLGATWRYRVRRESVDLRYRWQSEVVRYAREDDCARTCGAPVVTAHGPGARVAWALAAPAPSTSWTLLRAMGEGPFDSLATFAAGADTAFAYDDTTAAAGVAWRYALRRGCAYSYAPWTSAATTFWRPDTRAPLGLALANPTGGRLAFRLSGTAGLLWARLYDLQGRIVLQERLAAGGTGDDAFTLDLGASGARAPGIYFLRVTDGTGRTTRTARVAVVR